MQNTGRTIWLTGLSGAGKTTTSYALVADLQQRNVAVAAVDGDDLRSGLSSDLGFSAHDRDENVRRAGEMALILARQGFVVVVALISPRAVARAAVRQRHVELGVPFTEVYLSTPLEVCEARDPKALYRAARANTANVMTGLGDPYEAPAHPELTINTADHAIDEVVATILRSIETLN